MLATALIAVRTAIGIALMALVFLLMLWAIPGVASWTSGAMIAAVVSSILGGTACFLLAPLRGVAIALSAGGFLTFVLLGIMLLLKLHADGQSLVVFYWPVWFIPGSYLGARLGRYIFMVTRKH